VCTPVEQLTGMVQAMSLTPDDYEILAVSQQTAQVTEDTGTPTTSIDILLRCCEANWRFGATATSCAAALCHVDAVNSTDSGSFRNLWLKKLQSLFLRKLVTGQHVYARLYHL